MASVAMKMVEDRAVNVQPAGPRVLLVDDENSIQQTLSPAMPSVGYAFYQVRSGKEAVRRVQSLRPDLILLHLGFGESDGLEAIEHLRKWAIAPIIVISVRHEEFVKVSSLDSGAHDYLTNPFSVPELLARMRAALRSVNATREDVFTLRDLTVDLSRREVFVGGAPVRLTATEYDLLKVLIHNAGNVRTHRQLIHDVWGGTQYQDAAHLLRVTLSHLRNKLRSDSQKPRYIVTEPGVGYRLTTESKTYPRNVRQQA
jgi:two-component system KDP operon response regulator KdpE